MESWWAPALSADGRYVSFSSYAWNLVPGDGNNSGDVFVRDLQTGTTTRVSVGTGGLQANGQSPLGGSLSADARYVAFFSEATNLVAGDTNGAEDIFVHDRVTNETTRVSVDSTGAQADGMSEFAAISADGAVVAFDSPATNLVAGDTNGNWDVFLHDMASGETRRASIGTAGAQADGFTHNPAVDYHGDRVTFVSEAPISSLVT